MNWPDDPKHDLRILVSAFCVAGGLIVFLVIGSYVSRRNGDEVNAAIPVTPPAPPAAVAPRVQALPVEADKTAICNADVEIASKDAGQDKNSDSPEVKEFNAVLNSLQQKTGVDHAGLVRGLEFAQDEMRKQGTYEGLRDLVRHIDDSIPGGAKMDFPQVLAVYETMRTTDLGH